MQETTTERLPPDSNPHYEGPRNRRLDSNRTLAIPPEETPVKAPGIAQDPPKRRRRRSSRPCQWEALATICKLFSDFGQAEQAELLRIITAVVTSKVPLVAFIPKENQ